MINLTTEKGTIDISKDVFMTIVGDAATGCFGVKGMAGRRESGVWQLLHRDSMYKGVGVTLSEDGSDVSLQLHIVVDHGVNLSALSASIMSEVSYKVKTATGIDVKTIDIYFDSMTMD